MSKRKGVSADEKRTRLLELFYEKKEFFQLKELEKIAPKEKGIVAQSVKEVLQGLVDDNLVDTEKIGTSIYFWAFQSKAKNEKLNRLNMLTKNLEEYRKKLEDLDSKLEKETASRGNDNGRLEALKHLSKLNEELSNVQKELTKYSHVDPEVIERYKTETEDAGDAINRWTDNIFAAKSWCKKQMGVDDKIFNQQFGIPQDLDYIEMD